MPSPFTSSFASAAAGNTNNEGGNNGRNTSSGDWYVTGQGEANLNLLMEGPASKNGSGKLIVGSTGHELVPTVPHRPSVDLRWQPASPREMVAK